MDAHHAGHEKKRKRNLELGGGLESGDGGDGLIDIDELEGQVSANGGRRHCGRPHQNRNLLWKIGRMSQQVRVICPEQILFNILPNLGSTRNEHHPLSIFLLFSLFFSKLSSDTLGYQTIQSTYPEIPSYSKHMMYVFWPIGN